MDLVIDKANDNFIQRQFVSQGDYKGRTMTVQVTDNGLIGKVPGLALNLRWRNQASGAADLSAFECIDVENSVFRIEYPQNMLTPGKIVANIQVIQNGTALHLKSFEITVQRLAGEMTGIVDKAEYGALVAVLADANKFRTDIDRLGMDKADKDDVETALAEKVNNTELNVTNEAVDNLVSGKVDKGGVGQVSWGMLAQDARDNISGDKVATVGPNSVSTTNIVDSSVTKNKLGFPQKMEFLSGGSMTIDLPNRIIKISAKSTLELLDGNFVWVGETDLSSTIPEVTSPPVYFYVDNSTTGKTLNSTTNLNQINSKCIVVASVYNDILRYPTRFENVEFIGNGVTSPKTGEIIGNPIYVDVLAKTAKIPAQTFVRTENSYYRFDNAEESVLSLDKPGAVSLYFNHKTKEFKVIANYDNPGTYSATINENNLVLLGTSFDNTFYKSTADSNILFVNAVNTQTEITYLLDDLTIDEAAKQVTIPAGFKFLANTNKALKTNGRDYFFVPERQVVTIPDRTDSAYLWHLYFDTSAKTCRVGFTKNNGNEMQICSWWDGNVMDTLSPHKVIYNGVRGGKVASKKNLTLSEISNGLAQGEISTLCFYGDSTFAGATNGNPTNAFSALLGPMLSDEFGKTINVINGGHGGKSIGWLDTNFDTYFGVSGEYANAQVVVVGGGLNNNRTPEGINGNKASLQSIVNKLKNLGKEVVIATTQATCLTQYTADQAPSYERNQWGVYAFENSMRRDLAKENGLALLDFNEITSQFIMFSKYLETEICYDRLHFTDLGHRFEAGWLCSQLINRAITIDDRFLITPATHNIKSNVEWHAIENLAVVDENGFKSQINLDGLADGTLIYDTLIFNESKKPMQLKGFLSGGSVNVTINDETPVTLNANGQLLTDMEMGYYHIQVKATGTTGKFKGLVFE